MNRAEQKLLRQLELEKQDPPVPIYMEKIYQKCIRAIRTLKLRFKVQVDHQEPHRLFHHSFASLAFINHIHML